MASGGKEFAVNTPGGQVRLADLPLGVLEAIEEETGRGWFDLVIGPGASAKSARLIYAAACAEKGVEPEPLTPRRLVSKDAPIFERVPEDLPTVFEDGLPKAEGGTSTSTSSGAPSDSAGPQT